MNCFPWRRLGACLTCLAPALTWPAQPAFAEDAGSPGNVVVVERASGKVALRGPTVLYSVAEGLFFDTVHRVQSPAGEPAAGYDVCTAVGVIRVEGRDIHVLGYCFDPTNLSLNLELKEQHRRRKERIRAILKKLGALGVELSFEKVQSFSRGGVLGRPHVAQALMAEEYVSSFSEAFQKYLGDGGAAFVEKRGLSVEEAIRLIHRAGGIAVLAHPLRTGVDDLLDKLPDWGLGGMEIVTGSKKAAAVRKLRDWAVDRKMACTGGSDYHGDQSPCGLGSLSIPYRALDDLRDKLEIQKTEWI